jgi:hypothetical protein
MRVLGFMCRWRGVYGLRPVYGVYCRSAAVYGLRPVYEGLSPLARWEALGPLSIGLI